MSIIINSINLITCPWSTKVTLLLIELCLLKKRYVEFLTFSPHEYDFIWKEGLSRCHQVKMKSLRLALIQCDLWPSREREFWTRTHANRTLCEDKTQKEDSHVTWR